jgi:flagellar hook-associated protein 1 FlgK
MSGDLLGIAASGLIAAQRALSTIGNNIANANTEGYSRQRVDLAERDSSLMGGNYVGNGVNIASVTRSYDNFLNTQVRASQSANGSADAYGQLAAQIDGFLADPDAGLSSPLQAFFDSAQAVANDPGSVAARQVMLAQGDNLAQRFNAIDGKLNTLREQVQQTLSVDLEQVNTWASGIADLNTRIVAATAAAHGQPPNDLLDQRNLLVEKLSAKIGTTVIPEKNGAIDVFIGNGQSLVMGPAANRLQLQGSAYDARVQDIALSAGGNSPTVITQAISGGEIGGLLKFGSELLDPAQNSLGRIAAGLGLEFNAQHVQGTDLNGDPGQDFFADPTLPADSWFPRQSNAGAATGTGAGLAVAFDNRPADPLGLPANGPADLTASDYRLDYDNSGQATLTRLSDNAKFSQNDPQSFDSVAGAFRVDGLKIGLAQGSPAAQPGDSFLITPFRTPAGTLRAALSDPALIAAAGQPPTGPGDNSNALALAGLQTAKGLLGGKASFQGAYGQFVGEVGVKANAANIDSAAQKKLLDQASQSRESVSGVNLDEEAASLVRFQQAYQASAQLIPALNATFNALLSAVGG